MATYSEALSTVGTHAGRAVLVTPSMKLPAMLFIHGWDADHTEYLEAARAMAAKGCICLTYDLPRQDAESPADTWPLEKNLQELLEVYDSFAGSPGVDASNIGVVGSNSGAFLAALLTDRRPVKWLGLRVPTLCIGNRPIESAEAHLALAACARFRGDILIATSEHDTVVPRPDTACYHRACADARSLTCRVIAGADHALSQPEHRRSFETMLTDWLGEMVAQRG